MEEQDQLQLQVERVRDKAIAQQKCSHAAGWSYAANRLMNGKFQYWRRCVDCGGNVIGRGRWVPVDQIRSEGIELESVPVTEDHTTTRPPCRVCGARGTELHHWAPRGLFGQESEVWPTDYLCPACHQRWHQTMERIQVQNVLPFRSDPQPLGEEASHRGASA